MEPGPWHVKPGGHHSLLYETGFKCQPRPGAALGTAVLCEPAEAGPALPELTSQRTGPQPSWWDHLGAVLKVCAQAPPGPPTPVSGHVRAPHARRF